MVVDAEFQQAKELQTQGNAFYRDGKYDDARRCYTDALALLGITPIASSPLELWMTTTLPSEQLQTAAQLYSNRAQTAIQQRDFAAALQDTSQALQCDPANEKAIHRKLIALENLERFEAAFQQVETILEEADAREKYPVLFQYALTARRRLRKNLVRDKQVAVQEVEQMGKMVHENQQLRINFGCLLPSEVPLGQYFDVSVNIGNEFGLFRRDYVKPGEHIYLQVILRNNEDRRYQLRFQYPLNAYDTSNRGNADEDGRLTLNERGKVSFRLAITLNQSQFDLVAMEHDSGRANMSIRVEVHKESKATWNLFPVVSLPFSLVPSSATLVEGNTGELGVHCCRSVQMEGLDREILLAESPGSLGIGGKLWDSCLVLTRYLAEQKELLVNKRVIELGSGLGLVGIYCAMLGANVTLTDIEEVVPLLKYNIALNYPSVGHSNGISKIPTADVHFWGTSTANLPLHPDVIVLSDVVYDPEGYAPLVTSLDALASPDTLILMSHRSRNPMEHQFFELLGKVFTFELVDWASCLAEKSDVDPGEQALQDVKIFRMQRLGSDNRTTQVKKDEIV